MTVSEETFHSDGLSSEDGFLATRLAATVLLISLIFVDFFSEPFATRYLLMPRAVVEEHGFAINSFIDDPRHTPDIAVSDGKYYCGSYPGVGFAILPAVAAGIWAWPHLPQEVLNWTGDNLNDFLCLLATILVMVPTLAAATFTTSRICSRLGLTRRENIVWTLGFILGTPLVFYGARLHDTPIVLLAECNVILLLLKGLNSRTRARWWALGMCFGILDLTNPMALMVTLLAVGALMIGKLRFDRLPPFPVSLGCLGMAAAGAVLPEILLRGYLWSAYGSPFASSYSHAVHDNVITRIWAQRGLESTVKEIIRCIPEILWGTTFGERGLFVYAPICFIVFYLVIRSWKHPWARAGLVAYAANLAVVMTFIHGIWTGGKGWGPRYLHPALPWMFFAAIITRGIVTARAAAWLTGITAVSVFMTWLGLQYGSVSSPLPHLIYFLLSGPTTPLTRYAAHMADAAWISSRVAAGMSPSAVGQYYALTHIQGFAPYILVAIGLYGLWHRPVPDKPTSPATRSDEPELT
jgi:hypothetical protein